MKTFNTNTVNNESWFTPPGMIKALGEFDLDPCTHKDRPWDTAKNHYTIEDDGLFMPWFGRVWMNPPYGSKMAEWLNKIALHGNGIALTFARTDTKQFHYYVFPFATSILFMKGRISFFDINGKQGTGSGAPSVLLAYGESNSESIDQSGLKGYHLPLNPKDIIVIGLTRDNKTWKVIVDTALTELGSQASLDMIYDKVIELAPGKVKNNKHYREKIRQTLQLHFNNIKRGLWQN